MTIDYFLIIGGIFAVFVYKISYELSIMISIVERFHWIGYYLRSEFI